VTRSCPDFEPLLLDRAAGTLDEGGARLLEAHLASCLPCRTEEAAVARALSLAVLPPPSAAEAAAVAAGAARAATAWRADRRERRFAGRIALAVAASAAFALAVPWFLFTWHAPAPPPSVEAEQSWEPPDLDAVWAAAAVADPDATDAPPSEVLFAELEEIDLDPE
jgi:hypothetical protein